MSNKPTLDEAIEDLWNQAHKHPAIFLIVVSIATGIGYGIYHVGEKFDANTLSAWDSPWAWVLAFAMFIIWTGEDK